MDEPETPDKVSSEGGKILNALKAKRGRQIFFTSYYILGLEEMPEIKINMDISLSS